MSAVRFRPWAPLAFFPDLSSIKTYQRRGENRQRALPSLVFAFSLPRDFDEGVGVHSDNLLSLVLILA